VNNNKLENIEDHRAGPTTKTVREVGSAKPGRVGRTPFTIEDDHFLLMWCTRAERKGILLKGNELYKQLEEKVYIRVPRFFLICVDTSSLRTLDTHISLGEIVGSNMCPINHAPFFLRIQVSRKILTKSHKFKFDVERVAQNLLL
jgi:hypothetical protein